MHLDTWFLRLVTGDHLVNVPCHPFICGLPVLGHPIALPTLPGTTLEVGLVQNYPSAESLERRRIEEDTTDHEIPSSPSFVIAFYFSYLSRSYFGFFGLLIVAELFKSSTYSAVDGRIVVEVQSEFIKRTNETRSLGISV